MLGVGTGEGMKPPKTKIDLVILQQRTVRFFYRIASHQKPFIEIVASFIFVRSKIQDEM